MTRLPPRITLRIDRITSDQPGLDRTALAAALRAEVAAALAGQGAASFERNMHRAQAQVAMPAGTGPLAARVATAAIKAVKP